MVDSCVAEFAAKTPYYYSTYEPASNGGIDHIPDLQNRVKERYVAIEVVPFELARVLNLIMAVSMQ